MERVHEEMNLDQVPRPCEYFDIIGGTSTGGIIAIMLGRLSMTVDECVRGYKKVAEQAFTPKPAKLPMSPSGAFSATELERAIKQTVREYCTQPECVEQRRQGNATIRTCPHEDMVFRDRLCTKTVVLAITKEDVDTLPTLFKTYDVSASLDGCKIWQVARATSAATTFFKSIRLGRDDDEFVDAGFGYNNPCEVLIDEAQKRFPGRERMHVLSIGTGLGGTIEIEDDRVSILKALKKMATSSKKVAMRLHSRFVDGGVYYRFNVDRGLHDVTLSDWKKSSQISSHTKNYLRENEQSIEKFVRVLIEGDRIQPNVYVAEDHRIENRVEPPFNVRVAMGHNVSSRTVHIPFPKNRDFVERTETLNTLQQLLFTKTNTPQVALVGLGGMGKTQIALHLAHWVKANKVDFSVFWLAASSMVSFQQGCSDLIKNLGIQCAENEDVKLVVHRHLSSERAGNWFLIIDNVDDTNTLDGTADQKGIYHFLPQNDNGRTLITTRSQEVAVAVAGGRAVVRLTAMSYQEAISFLENSLTETAQLQDTESIAKFLDLLTNLPLAIAQALAYIRINDITIKRYVQIFDQTNLDRAGLLRAKVRDPTHYAPSQGAVATTWMISLDQIQQKQDGAITLLSFMACIEPKAIPRSILPRLESEEQLTSAIGTLCGYGFISRRGDDEVYDMHSLVYLTTQFWLESQGTLETARLDAVEHLTTIFPRSDWENRELWIEYLPHALKILETPMVGDEGCKLGFWVGLCLLVDGREKEALKVLQQVVAIQAELPENDPYRLGSQHALAEAYLDNGQVNQAIKLLEQVVAIKEILPEDHPSQLASQHKLAEAYHIDGQLDKAIKMIMRVMEKNKRVFGEGHAHTLTGMHTLASIYGKQGRSKEAEELYITVIKARKRVLKEEHPATLNSMHSLAFVYDDQGRWDEAEELYITVIEAEKRVLGEEHPETLTSMHNLASVYKAQGRWKEAEELYITVIEARKMVLGEEHSDTLTSMHNLALTYSEQDRWKEAIELLDQVVAIAATMLGKNDPLREAFEAHLAHCIKAAERFSQ
ncbi:hypothetical protein G7046_g8431 [Stylonectria norvegica]|nr:hypothetical protein G7046_g8431 [Stylonectria norvegica]